MTICGVGTVVVELHSVLGSVCELGAVSIVVTVVTMWIGFGRRFPVDITRSTRSRLFPLGSAVLLFGGFRVIAIC